MRFLASTSAPPFRQFGKHRAQSTFFSFFHISCLLNKNRKKKRESTETGEFIPTHVSRRQNQLFYETAGYQSKKKKKEKEKKVCDLNKQKPFRMRLSSETARSSVSDQNKGKSKCQKDRGMAQIFAYDNEQCHRPIRTKVDRNAPSLKDKCSLKLVQNGIKAAVSERQQPKRRPQRRHRPTERNRC